MKLKFNKRKFFYFSNHEKHISLEIAGFDSTPGISLNVDGGECDVTFHIAFGIGLWITFSRFLPDSWYPQDKSDTYGLLPGEREISIRFHHGSLWWVFWKDNTRWTRGDSKLRSGSFDFIKLIKGNHTCEWQELEKEMHTISMLEGNYSVEVTKKLRVDRWTRWFTNKSISYDVKAGYYQGGTFIELPIPVEGKGENSWDCGENATFSSHFPAKNDGRHDIKNCLQAALYFEQSMKKNRAAYGGKDWMPKDYKANGLNLIVKP